ncbi:DUF6082 family protein [Streptomyces sp. NPDC052299]|uniref:DUF6082 family protein n=1 Tax=Streptomyces sp. NPDC052299 TaxID=3155054 RepID=UPI00343CB163
MKSTIPLALALGTAVGAAHLVLTARHHRDVRHLGLAQMHGELIRDTAANPEFNQITNYPYLEDLDDSTRVRLIHTNRWVSLWSTMLRLRFMPLNSMRQVAAEFMRSPVGRQFREQARDHRRITARDKHDAAFNSLMNEAYQEARADAA